MKMIQNTSVFLVVHHQPILRKQKTDNLNRVRVTEEQETRKSLRGTETYCKFLHSAFTLGACGQKEDSQVFQTFVEREKYAGHRHLRVCTLSQQNSIHALAASGSRTQLQIRIS